jgi:hypothetical protein
LIESTKIMVVYLKLKIEEARVTEEALTKMLVEKDKENEGLKIEVVSLRNKVQENNMNHSSQVLYKIISSQRSTYDKTGIGYKFAVTNGCSSSSIEKAGTEDNDEKITSKKMESERQEENQGSTVHRRSYGRHKNKFEGRCFFCYKYGHKATFCNIFSRKINAHNNHERSNFEYGKGHGKTSQNNINYSYNRFDTLRYETECYKCNNFEHVSRNYPMSFQKFNEPTYTDLKTKYWKKKSENLNTEK